MYGIDISHHQNPATLPWDRIAASSSFCICRATYGARRDRHVAEHMRRARSVGLQVGLYAFFRPSQPVVDQIAAFRAAAQAAGYQHGDIIPALDVEADPVPTMQHVTPAWEPGVRQFADALAREFGALPLIYITQREFGMLGKPTWVLDHPLWVANYTAAAKPATPGNQPWTIWQHRVAPYDPKGAGGYDKARPELDQNRAAGPLPFAQRVPWDIAPAATPVTVPEADDDGWDEACTRAIAAQIDVVGTLHADAMREMAGLPTQPPDDPGDA
jgi:hypothetical protein